MSFCPICKGNHDPDLPCFDKSTQALRDMGIKEKDKKPKESFKKLSKQADKFMFKFLIIIFSLICFIIIIRTILFR